MTATLPPDARVRLARGCMTIRVDSAGGRVIELGDNRLGVEWLTQATRQAPLPTKPGEPWDLYPRAGWDECIPSIAPIAVGDTHSGGHKVLWSVPWQVSTGGGGIVAEGVSPDSSYALRRSMTLQGPDVAFDYSRHALGDKPVPYLWAMHALMSLTTDVNHTFDIDWSCQAMYSSDSRLEVGTHLRWGREVPGFPGWLLGRQPREPSAVKLFTHMPAHGRLTSLRNRAGLVLESRPKQAPFAGVWLNYGAWSGGDDRDRHLEPTTAPAGDLLDAAVGGHARPRDRARAPGLATRRQTHQRGSEGSRSGTSPAS